MCADQHHPWGFTTGLPCLGTGPNHPRQYAASDSPDAHTDSEELAEREHEL